MMQTARRIILGVLAVGLLSVAILSTIIRFSGLPLGFIDEPINLFVRQAFGGGTVDIDKARLGWNVGGGFLEVTINRLEVQETSGAGLVAENVLVGFSRDAFMQQRRMVPQQATIDRLFLQQDKRDNLPAALEIVAPSSVAGTAGLGLAYLNEISIRDIRVGDYQTATANGSHILVLRENNRLKATVKLAYEHNGIESVVNALADIKDDGSGHADIELNRLDPRDIGRFSSLLSPLRGLQLPVTALLGVDFAAGGQPTVGTIELFVEPGEIKFTNAQLAVSEMIVSATADFSERRIAMNDIRFNVGGVAGRTTGAVNYEITERGQVSEIGLTIAGAGLQVSLPKLFSQKIIIPRAELSAFYDMTRDVVEIERLDLTHNFGRALTSGAIRLENRNPHFELMTRFGKMSRAGVDGLWPVLIAPRTRKWVADNVKGGRLTDGSISLNASLEDFVGRQPGEPMDEDAMLMDLAFENVSLTYFSHLPPLQNTNVRLKLRGKSFEAKAESGLIQLPPKNTESGKSTVVVDEVFFAMPHYRNPNQPVDIVLKGAGEVRDIVRAINLPPLNAVQNIEFDFDRLVGEAEAEVHLNIALFAKPENRKLKYKIDGYSEGLDIAGKFGPYKIGKVRGYLEIDNGGLHLMGHAEVNGVDGGFAWQQPFGKDGAAKSKLAVHGHFSPQNIADLGQAWAAIRLEGAPHINLLIDGPIEKPDRFFLQADLTPAVMKMLPLAYKKPKGEPAHIAARIENNDSGEVSEILANLEVNGESRTDIRLSLDGDFLTALDMTPLSLGRDRNVVAKIDMSDDARIVSLTADKLDVSQLFAAGNRDVKYTPDPFEILPFLGEHAVINAQINQLLGANKVEMDLARVRVLRRNNVHEKLSFQGVFKDGSEMLMRIDRDNPARRRFLVQAERAGNIFRMFDWASEMYGGRMVMQGNIFDGTFTGVDGRKDIDGRLTMTDFRARNVPVLASILTLASLTGIADTLSGDGIEFEKAQGDFSLADGRLTIEDGRMHGAAVGLTMQGDFDIGLGDVDIGGTLVPAYSINSLLGKIPLVGPVLTGRRGEGIIGIGYRISGEGGKANVLVNPLSVLTPGVFRRIFELGIGLGERGEQINPDLDEPELTD